MPLLRDVFKGVSGQYDSARILFLIGGLNGVITPVVFQAWAMYRGQPWDATSYCLAYGGMLSAVISLGGLGISIKEKGVASAKNTTPNDPQGGQP
jgi:putative hemolysin